MKSSIEILITTVILLSIKLPVLGQISDSISVISLSDSTSNALLVDSNWTKIYDEHLRGQKGYSESSLISFEVPTCSCLTNQKGQWFLIDDTNAYSGKCVVMSNSTPKDSVQFWFVPRGAHEDSDLIKYRFNLNQDENYLGNLRILSNYVDGKRDGTRSYFSADGSLMKVEFFNLGELEWTKYYLKGQVTKTEKK